jgi:hypothetical protein
MAEQISFVDWWMTSLSVMRALLPKIEKQEKWCDNIGDDMVSHSPAGAASRRPQESDFSVEVAEITINPGNRPSSPP